MRVVSLCPSLTELVFDLGRGDDLVGRTKFCVHPAGRVEAVEKVGGTKNPKVARIVERATEAEQIARAIEEGSARVRAAAARRPGVSFAYLIWRAPLMTVNADTF